MGARRHERFDSDFTVKLDHGEALMRNVSTSGVYFLTELEFKAGDPVNFTLEFPGEQAGAISARCLARVTRVEPDGAMNGIAAAFESIEFFRLPGAA
jgi:hypothetical protein